MAEMLARATAFTASTSTVALRNRGEGWISQTRQTASFVMGGGSTRGVAKRGRQREAALSSSSTKRAIDTRDKATDLALTARSSANYYLMKSEPDDFSVDDLAQEGQSSWEGVRNYQARNVMQSMKLGDSLFFYHSSCKVPGIVGIAEVVKESYPDGSAFDASSKYYDPKSAPDKPRWFMVDIRLVRKLRRCISLAELKQHKDGPLRELVLLNRGRLSVQPVTRSQWDFILAQE